MWGFLKLFNKVLSQYLRQKIFILNYKTSFFCNICYSFKFLGPTWFDITVWCYNGVLVVDQSVDHVFWTSHEYKFQRHTIANSCFVWSKTIAFLLYQTSCIPQRNQEIKLVIGDSYMMSYIYNIAINILYMYIYNIYMYIYIYIYIFSFL